MKTRQTNPIAFNKINTDLQTDANFNLKRYNLYIFLKTYLGFIGRKVRRRTWRFVSSLSFQ